MINIFSGNLLRWFGTSACICSTFLASAQAGSLDFSFGSGGKVHPAIMDSARAMAMTLQPDGKILIAGQVYSGSNGDALVARLNGNGSMDPSFGTGGKMLFDLGGTDYATGIALQSDGKIVLSVINNIDHIFTLLRLNADSSPDTGFDGDGLATMNVSNVPNISAIALQPDGKIVAAGSSGYHYATARFNSDGSPDSTYNGSGFASLGFGVTSNINIVAVAVQSDGKIVIAGTYTEGSTSNFYVIRLTATGALDVSFNGSGIVPVSFTPPCGSPSSTAVCNSMVLQADGKILMAGEASDCDHTDNALARVNTDGSYDESFGIGGQIMYELAGTNAGINSLALQGDGKILAAGYALTTHHAITLSRYAPNGALDTDFGSAFGVVITAFGSNAEPLACVVQPDNKPLLAGFSNISGHNEAALVRYNPNALGIHENVSENNLQVYPNPVENILNFSSAENLNHAALRLVNAEGKTVISRNNLSGQHFTFDLSSQAPGLYILELTRANQISRTRIVKQ